MGSMGYIERSHDNREIIKYSQRAAKEYEMQKQVKSKFVESPIRLESKDNRIGIRNNFIKGESLSNYILGDESIFENEKIELLYQIANGVCDIHKSGVIHRDIKPDNIIVDEYGCIRIIDFDISERIGVYKSDNVGSEIYSAPETIAGFYDLQCDVYSLGLVAYFIFYEKHPFKGVKNRKEAKQRGEYPEFPKGYCKSFEYFVRWLCDPFPFNRPDSQTVITLVQNLRNFGSSLNHNFIDPSNEWELSLNFSSIGVLSIILTDFDHPGMNFARGSFEQDYNWKIYHFFQGMLQGDLDSRYFLSRYKFINDIDNIPLTGGFAKYESIPIYNKINERDNILPFDCKMLLYYRQYDADPFQMQMADNILNENDYILWTINFGKDTPCPIAFDIFSLIKLLISNYVILTDFYSIMKYLGYYISGCEETGLDECFVLKDINDICSDIIGFSLLKGEMLAQDLLEFMRYVKVFKDDFVFLFGRMIKNIIIIDEKINPDQSLLKDSNLEEGSYSIDVVRNNVKGKIEMITNKTDSTKRAWFIYNYRRIDYYMFWKNKRYYPLSELPPSIKSPELK